MSDHEDFDVKRCAKCAAWIPRTATKCSYCDTSSPDEPPARPKGPVFSLRHGVSATEALIAVNGAMFLFSLAVAKLRGYEGSLLQWGTTGTGFVDGMKLAGGYVHGLVVNGREWWRVLSAAFLHYGLIHIVLNMLALREIGRFSESLFGTSKVVVAYVFSAATASTAAGLFGSEGPHQPVVAGASGAIFGLLGFAGVFLLRAGTHRSREVGMMYIRSVVMMLGAGYLIPFVSNAGHAGGLVGGVACDLVFRDRFAERISPASRARWTRFALVAALLAAVSLAFAIRHSLTYEVAR